MYIFMKVLFKTIYSYGFHISKLNNLKGIHELYSQCLTKPCPKRPELLVQREYILFIILQMKKLSSVRAHSVMLVQGSSKLLLSQEYGLV
jgi:hypothetical protein